MTDLFDYAQSRHERDQAMEIVAESRNDWLLRFKDAICSVANSMATFTSDDVLEAHPELEECEEKRVIGAAFQSLSGNLITPEGYRNSSRRKSHARPKRVWRKIYQPNQIP
jgi:hypothetical protein